MIDIGVNLTNGRFQSDLDDVLLRAQKEGVESLIITGSDRKSTVEALELVQQYPEFLKSTAGVHPHHASDWNSLLKDEMIVFAKHSEVVAIGEMGLDFNRDFSPRDVQESCFEAQLGIAATVNKPVFLHQRDAHQRFVEILAPYISQLKGAVVHCFTGDKSELKQYLEMGCYIGITGWVCDERRGQALRDAVSYIPKDRLMIETDAPYLLPSTIRPKPKKNRNEPSFLKYVVEELARLREEDVDTIKKYTLENTKRFFDI